MPGVCLLLARIRELQDNVEEARRQYRALVDQERPPAAQLATYVDFLLRRGPADEADQRLKQLEKLLPADLGTVELRARWLRDQKRAAEIEPLVEGLAQKLMERLDKDKPQQEAQFARAIGDLYQRIEQFPAAERWYRRMLKLTPERYEPLAMSLAKQGRIQEAVALCIEAGKTDTSVRPALLLTMVLVSGRATAQDLASADPYLKKALENHKDQPALLANIANIRVLQDRSGEAIELYRQILAQQPRNVNVLNNLATLLAEQPEPEKRKEAAEYIEQAINLAGPQAGLLDTKAMALLHDGKPDQAVGLLQEATQVPSPDPRWCFHLAVACGRLGQLDKGRAALQQARACDLDHLLLTKTDRQLLADLEKKLGL
jgi:Tfp pilus assembly protein PilF